MRHLLILSALFVAGCASVTTVEEWQKMESLSHQQDLVWVQGPADQKKVDEIITQSLQSPLTLDTAVRIALINNSHLQMHFETLGISKSDLVQAGLFSNPSLSALLRFPLSSGKTSIEADALFSISDLWLVPLRIKVEEAKLEQTLLETADQILKIKKQAQQSFADYYYANQIVLEAKSLQKLLQDLKEEAEKRHKFGYMNEREVALVLAQAYEADVLVDQYTVELKAAKLRLLRILGLQERQVRFSPQKLNIAESPNLPEALQQAFQNRFDLQVAEHHLRQKEKSIDLASAQVFKDVHGGVSFEQSDGDREMGPSLELDLPLFDQNQAQISKAEFEWRMAKKQVINTKQDIRLQVEELFDKIEHLKRKTETYNRKIVPLHQKALKFTKHWAELMQINQLDLLMTKKDLIMTRIDYLKAVAELHHTLYEFNYVIGDK